MPEAFELATCEPAVLVAGDLWEWSRPDLASDYPPAEYALGYVLTPEAATPSVILLTAAETGGVFTISETDTADHAPGVYQWAAVVTRQSDSARRTVGRGRLRIDADPEAVTPADPRSYAVRCLAQIDAVLENRAGADVQSYAIEGRTLAKMPVADLLALRQHFVRQVRQERGETRPGQFRPVPVVLR